MYKLLPILLFTYVLAVTAEDIYDNSYALIIGIDKYQNVRSLDYAVKDAEDIQSMLVDKFNFQQGNIVLLKNKEATKASIIQEFSNITKKAGDNDRVLIFFAGHGDTEDLPDGGEMGYLLPVDGNKTDLYVSAIDMDEIQKLSLRSEAKHMLFLVDACYGGIVSVGARNIGNYRTWGEYDYETTQDNYEKTTKTNFLQKITQDKSRQIITAGGRDEIVQEKAEWGHSAFTKNLLRGLRDSKADINTDGYITAQELGSYLSEKVTFDSENQQTPQLRHLTSDEGQFIFFLDNQFISESTTYKNNTKSFKLIIIKYDSNFMNPTEFPPIISNSISTMITSAPNFIIQEPNMMDENISSKELEDWNNLMKILNQLENASIGDSITTYWADDYYFKVFVQ